MVGAIALTIPATAAMAAPPADDPSARFQKSDTSGQIDTSFSPSALQSDEKVSVVIEMEGDPVAVVQAEKGSELTSAEKSNVIDTLEQKQDAITGTLEAKGAEVTAQMQSAYNGIQVSIPANQIESVAELPGVVAVHSAGRHTIDNAVSVPFLGVPQVWQSTGYTGQGVKVAIIDTGIDWTHSDFGGEGTVEAYEAAFAVSDQPADPAYYGPDAPRIKGGIDMVGDDYNADPGSPSYQPIPKPDDNPLDCNGHGTHVAGTTGGSGVNADGSTFTGPYDETTSSNTFRVGPGVAPQVDLYGVRVFGCDGSTDVVVAAIDWAVENGMDVINMSLGSTWGRGDDPDAVAASNAVGAGVVVVASSGNSGHNPYMTGSPGSGDGVISVSAVDSSESFPGATITVNGTPVEAINANGAQVAGLGELTVVRLADIAGTAENEALGCSVAAYTANGIVEGANQLAVSVRGTCARAARPIYAQQAGAAAALMVNNADALPPYEGQITSNPDTGEPFDVTIPFLGVSQPNGAPFVTGATATLEAGAIANPGFRNYASFTSSGPRSGDGAISPDVAAPGVSIASAGVGTGNAASILSGTSMAAPHVAGVAALTVQSHPAWTAQQISAAVVGTADPEKVAGQSLTLGGVGLVDTAQAVATKVTATGDAFRTESGWAREAALSFGVQESWLGFGGIKTITIENKGDKSVTYKVSTAPSAQSLSGAKISVSTKSVTVRPGGKARVLVTAIAPASVAPTSIAGNDQFSFYEISGDVVLTAADSTLRVPYLLVPRSNSTVKADSNAPMFSKGEKVRNTTKAVKLTNKLGALDADADFYQWGLSDTKDATATLADTGYDLRAAGVQSLPNGDDSLLVFAVNTHTRWSNAASVEFDVLIDVDRDGNPEYALFAVDSGLVRAGDPDGESEVFLADLVNGGTFATGYYAQAPTDSSTILLPIDASTLGITGAFDYTVQSFAITHSGTDAFDGWASFNPAAPAITNGQYQAVPKRKSATIKVGIDAAAFADQKPLGSMVVVYDNKSGADEAILVTAKR
ncbi:PA domain-containing protein [Microbacterium sp. RU33B]|nr:PA domain-containing protein [Microbacterium sp. RU33B]